MGSPLGEPTVTPHAIPLITRYNLRDVARRNQSRLLLAEDNPVNQKVALRTLEKLGYKVDLAKNGLEALEALSTDHHYDAVLMDCQMPEMDGYEATAEIRRREARDTNGGASRRIPVIAMTANTLQGDREKALEAGMDDHIAKPVKPEDLAKRLEYWIPDTTIEMLPDAEPEEIEAPNEGTPPDEEPPLDENAVAGLRDLGGGPELLMELVDIFLGDAPPRLAELREAAKTGDASVVERVAHTLKGSASSMGAIPLGNVAADLQDVGSSGDFSDIESLLDRLEYEWERTLLALEGLKASERGNEA
jgi:CheY-like chemotaxis protein